MRTLPSNPLDARLTATTLEAALARAVYRLRFNAAAKRAEIERANFPSMIACFERRRKVDGLPPTQVEFVQGFAAQYQAARPELFSAESRAASEARLQKAYPSLVRDLHLYLLCRESRLFAQVWRGAQLDEREGVDVLLVDAQGREHYVCATAGTASAMQWRAHKQQTRNPLRPARTNLTGTFIELPLNIRPKKRIGDWWLYTRAHVAYVAERIQGQRGDGVKG